MPNQKALAILKQGSEAWNESRKANPNRADLSWANLIRVNFSTNLRGRTSDIPTWWRQAPRPVAVLQNEERARAKPVEALTDAEILAEYVRRGLGSGFTARPTKRRMTA